MLFGGLAENTSHGFRYSIKLVRVQLKKTGPTSPIVFQFEYPFQEDRNHAVSGRLSTVGNHPNRIKNSLQNTTIQLAQKPVVHGLIMTFLWH